MNNKRQINCKEKFQDKKMKKKNHFSSSSYSPLDESNLAIPRQINEKDNGVSQTIIVFTSALRLV